MERIREHIRAGDAFQVVLSQRFEVPTTVDALDLYRVLRASNPSPYMYLLRFAGRETPFDVVGSSPEALVTVTGTAAVVHPPAGTRPRGATEEEDVRLAEGLLGDPKERAEAKLVDELSDEAGVEISGADKIPHDLWPAADWPPLAWIDRLTLVAAQFDLTFRVDKNGKRVELVPLPDKAILSRTYEVPRDAAAVARRWAKEVPGAASHRREKQDSPRRSVGGSRAGRTASARHSLAALDGHGRERGLSIVGRKCRISQVVDQLASRLNLKFDWNRAAIDAAGISVDQLVSVKVQNASLDELLRAVLADTGLSFKRADRAISIYPATGR